MQFINLFGAFLLIGTAVAFRDYQQHIPNGDRVPDPCHPNKLWQGVGHKQLAGGGDRNLFGKDFKEAGKTWTKELCRKDSDRDGKTNGEELGDPDCKWKINDIPLWSDNITHPGICDPYNSDQCKEINNWQICQELEFDCPIKDGEGVIRKTYQMTRNKVPAQETTYQCQYMELPADRDYHLIASEPFIDNANVMHHMTVRGCPNAIAADIKVEFAEPTACGDVIMRCNIPLTGWTLGSLGYCLNAPAGFRFGKTRYSGIIVEFHWTNPTERTDYWDSSGITLYYTPNLRTYDAGALYTGQSHLVLPPRQQEVTIESFCPSRCTKKILDGPINIIRGFHHMHLLGKAGFVEHSQEGKNDTIIDEPFFSYDSPKTFNYKPEIILKPGDELKTTCVYNTMTREDNTYWGDGTFSEMCYGVFTYYPATSQRALSCVTIGEGDCMAMDESECDIKQLNAMKEELVNGLYEYCDPSGQTCSKCCLLYLKSTLKGDPCWSRIVRGRAEWIVSDRWKNRNVTKMLLKCEQAHDLNELLAEDDGGKKSTSGGAGGAFCFKTFYLILLVFIGYNSQM